MPENSKNKVAIVTGASRGIGRAIALKLKAMGYKVVGAYKSSNEKANEMSDQDIDMQQADVSQEAGVTRLIGYAIDKYGQLDVIVNNAGIDIKGKVETYQASDWSQMVATDVTSVFLMSKYAIPHLRKSDNACIINISSRLGVPEYAEPEFAVYCAMKAAVSNFTVALSKELAPDKIRVNAVIPAPTETELFYEVFTLEEQNTIKAKGKLGQPEDVAELVEELICDISANGKLLFDKRVSL